MAYLTRPSCLPCNTAGKSCFSTFRKLFDEPKGISISIQYLRNLSQLFTLLAKIRPEDASLSEKFKKIHKGLGEVKCVLGFFKIPRKYVSLTKSAAKTYKYSCRVLAGLKEGRWDRHANLKLVIYFCKTNAKAISVVKRSVFAPLFYIESHFSSNLQLDNVSLFCSVITLAGKKFKIIYMSLEVIDGADIVEGAIELVLLISSTCLRIIKLSGHHVHPAASLSLSICQNVYKIYKVAKNVA